MIILEKYIGKAITNGVISVIGVLTVLYIMIGFVNEANSIGLSNYTMLDAMGYSLLSLPEKLYPSFPLATLLGTMIGLGMLSRNSELVVIRSSGVSQLRLIVAIMKTAMVLILAAMIIGEVVAPPLHQYANLQRIKALSRDVTLNTEYGLWVRDKEDFIHVRRVNNKGQLLGITLYRFNDNNNLVEMIRARSADYTDERWMLRSVTQTAIDNNHFRKKQLKQMQWDTMLDPQLVSVVSVTPEMLPIWKLGNYISYLRDNGLDAAQYKIVFWGKLIMPFSILAMVLIAIPFIFASQRQTPIGKQVVIGFLVGISFFIVNKLMEQVGLVYQVHPLIVTSLPTLLVLGIAITILRRLR